MISNPEMNYPFQTVYQPMLLRTQQTVDQRMGTAKASAHQPSRFIVTWSTAIALCWEVPHCCNFQENSSCSQSLSSSVQDCPLTIKIRNKANNNYDVDPVFLWLIPVMQQQRRLLQREREGKTEKTLASSMAVNVLSGYENSLTSIPPKSNNHVSLFLYPQIDIDLHDVDDWLIVLDTSNPANQFGLM